MRVNKKFLFAIILLIISSSILSSKLMLPTTIQVIVKGELTTVTKLPSLYTFLDVLIIIASSSFLAASVSYLIFTAKVPETREIERLREATLRTLKGNERKVYEAIVNEGGVMFQSELVERTGLPKSTVSIVLDKLEAKGLLERRRRGISNVIVLK